MHTVVCVRVYIHTHVIHSHTHACIYTYIHTHTPGSARPPAAAAELRRGVGAIHVAVVARISAAAAAVPRLHPTPMPINMYSSTYTQHSWYTQKFIRTYMITYIHTHIT